MIAAHVHDHGGVDPVGAILLLIDAAVLIFVVLLLALRPGRGRRRGPTCAMSCGPPRRRERRRNRQGWVLPGWSSRGPRYLTSRW
jgi:hypothetical protein